MFGFQSAEVGFQTAACRLRGAAAKCPEIAGNPGSFVAGCPATAPGFSPLPVHLTAQLALRPLALFGSTRGRGLLQRHLKPVVTTPTAEGPSGANAYYEIRHRLASDEGVAAPVWSMPAPRMRSKHVT